MAVLGRRDHHNRRILGWTAIALTPQLLWLGKGLLSVPGFAGGTSWIAAPVPSDVLDVLSSSFAIGGLQMRDDGFVFTSAALLVVLGVVAAFALASNRMAPSLATAPELDPEDRATTGRGAAQMGLVAVLLVSGTYVTSQIVHIWTPRNLIAIQPAICWATVLLLVWLPRRVGHRRVVGALVFAALAAGLAGVGMQVSRTYKPDLRAVVRSIAAARSADSAAHVLVAPDLEHDRAALSGMAVSANVSEVELARRLKGVVYADPVSYLSQVSVRPGTSLFVYAKGNLPIPEADGRVVAAETIARAGGVTYCEREPVFGIVVVRCDVPG